MKYPYHKFLTAALAAVLLLQGCETEKPLPPPEPVPAERVFLMYDNIGSWFYDDVEEAGEAVAAGALGPDERVVVFHRNYSVEGEDGRRSVIYELVRDTRQEDGYRKEMMKVYPSGVNASLSTEVIAAVVGDIRAAIPADHYGLAFGSHGMGWVPASSTVTISRKGGSLGAVSEHPFADLWAERENPRTRYFRSDWKEKLDVSEFADALDEWKWDFIILDDCFMASIEALYEMRDLADYIIASPTEIMWPGFPYGRVVSTLFRSWSGNPESSVSDVAYVFVEDYRTGESGNLPQSDNCATIAVVKSSELGALAETIRRLNLNFNELTSVDGIQYYERYSRPGHVFFDLDDYLHRIRATTMPTEYNSYKAQLDRTVIFADHTEYFYSAPQINSGRVKINYFSGLNVFIPWSQTLPLIPAYQQTEWYKAVYSQQ
jgi:hypothetical protein